MATCNTAPSRQIISRIFASLLGGYIFVWGFVTLSIALLVSTGMSYRDAYDLTMMLAFLVFLFVFFWVFMEVSVKHVWIVLAGAGVAMTCLASVLTLLQL